jgi:hypothetical protein
LATLATSDTACARARPAPAQVVVGPVMGQAKHVVGEIEESEKPGLEILKFSRPERGIHTLQDRQGPAFGTRIGRRASGRPVGETFRSWEPWQEIATMARSAAGPRRATLPLRPHDRRFQGVHISLNNCANFCTIRKSLGSSQVSGNKVGLPRRLPALSSMALAMATPRWSTAGTPPTEMHARHGGTVIQELSHLIHRAKCPRLVTLDFLGVNFGVSLAVPNCE